MLDYIIRRVLFIIPTLLGIMFLNFLLVQFVPGGPVEQMIYQFENGSNLDLVGGGGTDAGQENNSNQSLSNDSKYKGAQGLPEEFIKDLEKQLTDQRLELGTNIKNSEEALIRTKEGFLKVEGALELINIIKTKLAEQEKETVEEIIGSS